MRIAPFTAFRVDKTHHSIISIMIYQTVLMRKDFSRIQTNKAWTHGISDDEGKVGDAVVDFSESIQQIPSLLLGIPNSSCVMVQLRKPPAISVLLTLSSPSIAIEAGTTIRTERKHSILLLPRPENKSKISCVTSHSPSGGLLRKADFCHSISAACEAAFGIMKWQPPENTFSLPSCPLPPVPPMSIVLPLFVSWDNRDLPAVGVAQRSQMESMRLFVSTTCKTFIQIRL